MGADENIVNGESGDSTLREIRRKIFENTVQILELVRERMELAQAVGQQKRSMNMPMRNRERELEIIGNLGNLDDNQKSILNMLFEITVLQQLEGIEEPVIDPSDRDQEGFMEIRGSPGLLSYFLGLVVSSPGFRLDLHDSGDRNLALGAIQRGGHVTGEVAEEDVQRFGLMNPEGECIAVLDGGLLRLSHAILSGKEKPSSLETAPVEIAQNRREL